MSSKSLVFITGATGFIGAKVLDVTLQAGHYARVSVRKETQIKDLKAVFPQHTDRIDFVVIPDLTKADAFTSVLKDVDYILHIASPMPGSADDFQTEYLKPAVAGTETILEAAKSVPSIKRVVVMSSLLALMPLGGLNDPNLVVKGNTKGVIPVDPNMDFPEGAAGNGAKYQASKILAHQATQRFVETQKPHYDVVTIHPDFVIGRNLVQKSAQDLGGINGWFVMSLAAEKPLFPPLIVHVDDVAETTLAAATANVEGDGREFIISGRKTTWDAIVKYVKAKHPAWSVNLQGPFPEYVGYDTSYPEKVLGWQPRSMEDIVDSLLGQQTELRGLKSEL